jgi:hypothetical protein
VSVLNESNRRFRTEVCLFPTSARPLTRIMNTEDALIERRHSSPSVSLSPLPVSATDESIVKENIVLSKNAKIKPCSHLWFQNGKDRSYLISRNSHHHLHHRPVTANLDQSRGREPKINCSDGDAGGNMSLNNMTPYMHNFEPKRVMIRVEGNIQTERSLGNERHLNKDVGAVGTISTRRQREETKNEYLNEEFFMQELFYELEWGISVFKRGWSWLQEGWRTRRVIIARSKVVSTPGERTIMAITNNSMIPPPTATSATSQSCLEEEEGLKKGNKNPNLINCSSDEESSSSSYISAYETLEDSCIRSSLISGRRAHQGKPSPEEKGTTRLKLGAELLSARILQRILPAKFYRGLGRGLLLALTRLLPDAGTGTAVVEDWPSFALELEESPLPLPSPFLLLVTLIIISSITFALLFLLLLLTITSPFGSTSSTAGTTTTTTVSSGTVGNANASTTATTTSNVGVFTPLAQAMSISLGRLLADQERTFSFGLSVSCTVICSVSALTLFLFVLHKSTFLVTPSSASSSSSFCCTKRYQHHHHQEQQQALRRSAQRQGNSYYPHERQEEKDQEHPIESEEGKSRLGRKDGKSRGKNETAISSTNDLSERKEICSISVNHNHHRHLHPPIIHPYYLDKFSQPDRILFPIFWTALLSDYLFQGSGLAHAVSVAVAIKVINYYRHYSFYYSEKRKPDSCLLKLETCSQSALECEEDQNQRRVKSSSADTYCSTQYDYCYDEDDGKEQEHNDEPILRLNSGRIANSVNETNSRQLQNQLLSSSWRLSLGFFAYFVFIRRLGSIVWPNCPIFTHFLGLFGLFLGQLFVEKLCLILPRHLQPPHSVVQENPSSSSQAEQICGNCSRFLQDTSISPNKSHPRQLSRLNLSSEVSLGSADITGGDESPFDLVSIPKTLNDRETSQRLHFQPPRSLSNTVQDALDGQESSLRFGLTDGDDKTLHYGLRFRSSFNSSLGLECPKGSEGIRSSSSCCDAQVVALFPSKSGPQLSPRVPQKRKSSLGNLHRGDDSHLCHCSSFDRPEKSSLTSTCCISAKSFSSSTPAIITSSGIPTTSSRQKSINFSEPTSTSNTQKNCKRKENSNFSTCSFTSCTDPNKEAHHLSSYRDQPRASSPQTKFMSVCLEKCDADNDVTRDDHANTTTIHCTKESESEDVDLSSTVDPRKSLPSLFLSSPKNVPRQRSHSLFPKLPNTEDNSKASEVLDGAVINRVSGSFSRSSLLSGSGGGGGGCCQDTTKGYTCSSPSPPQKRLSRSESQCYVSGFLAFGNRDKMRRTSLPAALPAQRPSIHHVSPSISLFSLHLQLLSLFHTA